MSEGRGSHYANYFMVFVALCVCTLLSIVFDVLDINNRIVLIALVLSVAVAKALFVMTYFMHLKFEGNWKFLLLAPTLILAMGLPMALLPDVGLHYYNNAAPQHSVVPHYSDGETMHDVESKGAQHAE